MKFPQKRGEFTLLRKIGEGGMAEVFLAEREGDEDFKTLVALKRLHGGFALDQYFIRQLVQEAKLLGQLQHTNIVRVNDLRRIDDEYYIAMEYIDGIDVAQAIQVHRDNDLRFPLSIFFHIALSLCEALDFAHSATDMDGKPIRLIHRDIKPSNVLISNRGIVKLTDFGIARVGDTSNTGSVVKGTANYMSPEQASGEQNLTPASDIFSLGAVFWEMLTLEKLVEGSNYLTVINSIKDLNVGLKDITKKGIEPGLRMILLRMLARKRELRYQSMGLVLKDLRFVAEQMKVDLSPSHLREYMAKITQLARDAAGKLESGTNIATAAAAESDADPSDLPEAAATQPAETVEETAAAPQEAAFAESVAALKALVQKDIDKAVSNKPASPVASLSAKHPAGGAPTAPPQPPIPRTPAQQAQQATVSTVDDDIAAPPSATGLHALESMARASKEEPVTSPGAEAPVAPAPAAKQSRKKKKSRKAGAPVVKAAPAVVAPVAAIPPAGIPTPPMKPAAPKPQVAARPAPPPPAPAPEPVMEMVGGADHDDGYDDEEDWDDEGGGFMLYAAVAAVILLLLAVIWLMLSGEEDPGGDVLADTAGESVSPGEDGELDPVEPEVATDVATETGDGVAEAGSASEQPSDSGADSAVSASASAAEAPSPTPAASASRSVSGSTSEPSSASTRASSSRTSSTSSSSSTDAASSPRSSSTSRDRASTSSRDTTASTSSRDTTASSSSRDRATASTSSRDSTASTSSRDTTASSSSRDRATASSSDSSSEPTYRGSTGSGTAGTGTASSSSSSSASASTSTKESGDDWASSSSDTRSPYADDPSNSDDSSSSDDASNSADEPTDDGPVAMAAAPDAAQVLDDYSDLARRGRLGTDEIAKLQGIGPAAASYEPSRAVLLAQYEATGDQSGHCSVAGEVLAQPGNYADPQWNLEMSKCHLRKGRFEDALASSRVAELHAQDIPARSRTDRQLKIWEIQAKAYKGLYQGTENLDYLSDAIAVWKRYQHLANNTYRPREATRAEEAIAALQDLSEGSL